MTQQDWIIDSDWSEQERRQYERYSTEFYLCVYEQNRTSPLGQVIDISLGGLQLVSSEPIELKQHFNLVMDVSLESGLHEQTQFEAETVWSSEDDNDDLYNTGFQFLNLSSEALQALQRITNELGG
ncbi:MAG: PilZ domain-containing protein [Synechococcaceae cyanobacterium SM1_2_3]|nr:PilZ domain-containing protein [Synechococcaceae cyanobacterium SM1_2_3]